MLFFLDATPCFVVSAFRREFAAVILIKGGSFIVFEIIMLLLLRIQVPVIIGDVGWIVTHLIDVVLVQVVVQIHDFVEFCNTCTGEVLRFVGACL